ncbi:hypothetical protein AKN87_11375 [Thiopseudomonas alkaliphila]|uniref:hypothetical protein n=1 Tax=Thiopseudomonas alkaliphila TaxID=1697053 RepID=UPI00069D50FE|nr:hypothetical protein [Thiopseudomonas alkaliphila]AKX45624.1 hypothetical protein AKN87_11375 [Thiopseudomonas alkaliphila]AKX48895.1 hypothetical protein AKN93_05360 [Thiopseudomonas alkaliphila]AKX55005.1 hypothetical protein AKN90_04245 [Thiopseudomonas alkaliphila]
MNFKFLLVFFSAVMLVACGKPDTDLDDVQPAVAPKASSTAIFLPGGEGIDFGKAPILVREGVDNGGTPYKLVTFEFVEQAVDVDLAINKLLKSYGYERREIPDDKLTLRVIYSKNNSRILFRYSNLFKEGFTRKTSLVISWAVK